MEKQHQVHGNRIMRNSITPQPNRPRDRGEFNTQLHSKLRRSFNIEELHTICLKLGLIYENVPGKTLDGQMTGFIEMITRHELYDQLLPILKQERPNVEWPLLPSELSHTISPASTSSTPVRSNTLVQTKPLDGKVMVLVPAGEFMPGYKPFFLFRLFGYSLKTVSLPAFWIDKEPVTNGEYAEFVKAHPGVGTPSHWNGKLMTIDHDMFFHPVVNVTWENARAYAKWIGKRLPTVHEWEKAARGGVDCRTYPWGDQSPKRNSGHCNFGQLKNRKKIIPQTTRPGAYSHTKNSPYGCVDMCGNVQEWTEERKEVSNAVYAGLKGGSWAAPSYYLPIGKTNYEIISKSANDIGFRLVKDEMRRGGGGAE